MCFMSILDFQNFTVALVRGGNSCIHLHSWLLTGPYSQKAHVGIAFFEDTMQACIVLYNK